MKSGKPFMKFDKWLIWLTFNAHVRDICKIVGLKLNEK